MTILLCRFTRRLQVVLGLALLGLVFAPSALAQGQRDTVTVTGNSASFYSNINITAQSGTSGQIPAEVSLSGHLMSSTSLGR
jgi:hypothetical protein